MPTKSSCIVSDLRYRGGGYRSLTYAFVHAILPVGVFVGEGGGGGAPLPFDTFRVFFMLNSENAAQKCLFLFMITGLSFHTLQL